MPHAYLLRCSDGSYYAGSTNSLEHRLFQHHEGLGPLYTRRRRPVELVWAGEFATVADAFAFEQQLKGWGRAKREALIEGRYLDLPGLSSRSIAAIRARAALRDGAGAPPQGPKALGS